VFVCVARALAKASPSVFSASLLCGGRSFSYNRRLYRTDHSTPKCGAHIDAAAVFGPAGVPPASAQHDGQLSARPHGLVQVAAC
jgi:hypothetical protein